MWGFGLGLRTAVTLCLFCGRLYGLHGYPKCYGEGASRPTVGQFPVDSSSSEIASESESETEGEGEGQSSGGGGGVK